MTAHPQQQQQSCLSPKNVFCVTCGGMDLSGQPMVARASGAAQRRKLRRLRAALRHELQSIAMALASALHHSADKTTRAQHNAPRGQKNADTEYYELSDEDEVPAFVPPPPCLGEPRGPQDKVQQRTMEQIVDDVPMLTLLDSPGGPVGGSACSLRCAACRPGYRSAQGLMPPLRCARTVLCTPQTVEQLVEVPTIVFLFLTTADYGGRLPEQRSPSTVEQIIYIPFLVLVVVVFRDVLKVFPKNGVQQRVLWSRMLTFQFPEVACTVSLFLALQAHPQYRVMCVEKGFFAHFPRFKKVRRWVRIHGRNCSPSHAGSSCGLLGRRRRLDPYRLRARAILEEVALRPLAVVPAVGRTVTSAWWPRVSGCGSLWLLRGKSGPGWRVLSWSTLLRSGWNSRWCRLCLGPPVSHGGFGKNFLFHVASSSRCSHWDIWTLPSPSYLSVLLVYGCCLWSTSYWFFREILRAPHADDAFEGFFFSHFSPGLKRCDTTSALWVGTAFALEPMEAGSL